MSPPSYKRSGLSPLLQVLLALAVLFVGSVGSVVVLAITGVIELPFLRRPGVASPKPKPEGVPIPLSARPITAFTQVTREDIMDLKTLDLVVTYLPPESVARAGLLPVDKVLGRVLKADKAAGYGFTEKDFLPKGTRPGVAGGVPTGKRAFVLEADKVAGVHGLHGGDRVDLLATLAVDPGKGADRGYHGGMSFALYEAQNPSTWPRRAGVRALVQDGVVVLPVKTREVPLPGGGATRDGKPRTRPIQEITLAIDPREVAPLTEALALNANVCCVAHSGLPDEPPGETPGSAPPRPTVRVIQTIVGKKHDVVVFPVPPAPETRTAVPEDKGKPKDRGKPEDSYNPDSGRTALGR